MLWVLAQSAPSNDLTTLHVAGSSLRVDVDSILEMRGVEPESAPVELAVDTVLAALFTNPPETQAHQLGHSMRNSSSCTTVRRPSLIYEEARQVRAREMIAGVSSSIPVTNEMSTTEGVDIEVGST